jgi:glycerophosphoryl diester phosphodiesterase
VFRILKWAGRVLGAILAFLAAAWLVNASWWSSYSAKTTILAHRGLHQTYSREDLERDTCTANRIHPPEHGYIENTIDSMAAAFALGADVVELDVHPTTDGQFAVFHDWTVDCRTEGKGVTREQSMAYLKTLDIGYGYTADGGKTFPFRGKFVGAMPTLDEVLARFPDKRFLINIKSRDPEEGRKLAARLKHLPAAHQKLLMSYGGDAPEDALKRGLPGLRTLGKKQLTDCVLNYMSFGWTGIVPRPCKNTLIFIPQNYAPLLWGWPNRFVERMHSVGSEVYIRGPYTSSNGILGGIDTLEQLDAVPKDFPGGIWTDRIDLVAKHRPNAKVGER